VHPVVSRAIAGSTPVHPASLFVVFDHRLPIPDGNGWARRTKICRIRSGPLTRLLVSSSSTRTAPTHRHRRRANGARVAAHLFRNQACAGSSPVVSTSSFAVEVLVVARSLGMADDRVRLPTMAKKSGLRSFNGRTHDLYSCYAGSSPARSSSS
jgi:hypothetical protein